MLLKRGLLLLCKGYNDGVEVVVVVMGRPKVPGESVYVRLDPELAEALTRYVQEQDGPARTTKNSVINFALKKFFEEIVKKS